MRAPNASASTCSLFLVALIIGQSSAAVARQREQSQRFTASTAAVVVDVVVRDKTGRSVPGLRADDFEVYEDGTKQRITSFDSIARPAVDRQVGSEPTKHSGDYVPPNVQMPTVIAVVFEQLSPQGRRLAYNAASTILGTALGSNDFVGVFFIDRALHLLVPYTHDLAQLRRGMDEASRTPGYAIERAGQIPGAEFGSAQPGELSKASKDDSPYFRAHATFDALDRLIASLRSLPGRKAVVLFSEGFALGPSKDEAVTPGTRWHDRDDWLSDSRYQHFAHVIERANHAHVAFYTFDAAGLRVESPFADSCFGCPPFVGLKFLADESGGAFVESTNDLVPGVRRAIADMREYYLLGYTSTKPKLDGRYRKISIKVRRRGVTVLARQGYRASPESDRLQVHGHEVGPLLALEDPTPRNDLAMQMGTLLLPTQPGKVGRIAILARVSQAALSASAAPASDGGLTVFTRIKNAAGETMTYASETFRATDSLQAAGGQLRDVLFYKEANISVGPHLVEVSAYDARTGRASVRRTNVDVPAARTDLLQLGDILILRSGERASGAATERLGVPALRVDDWLLVPDFGEPIQGRTTLAFAFAAYVAPASEPPVEGSVAILQDGRQISHWRLNVETAPQRGLGWHVSHLSLGDIAPGAYELAVTLTRGPTKATRVTTFRITRQ